MRVCACDLLYRLCQGVARTTAGNDLKKIWQPDGVWREFVNQRFGEMKQQSL
jgi:hypothetical protein